MGGVVIKEMDCADYTTALAVDRDIALYIDAGLKEMTDSMTDYSWFWWLMWIYSMWVHDYMKVIYDIMTCGISNNVEGSAYANEDYKKDVFLPTLGKMGETVLNDIDLWWHPALVIFLSIFPGTWLIYLAVSIIFMGDYQTLMLEYISQLK